MVSGTVVDVSNEGSCFLIREKAGREWRSRTVLIATGLVDHLPEIPDIAKYYGTSVFHCPYCDAWENRGLPMGVISGDEAAAQLAEELLAWSDDVTLFSHREDASDIQKRLVGTPVKVVPGEVTGLEGEGGILHFVCVGDRRTECRALFFSPAQAQHSTLAQRLGCRMEEGMVGCGPDGGTGVAGLFVAGNVSGGVQMAIVAAAEGVKAAVAIHEWLSRYALSRI
jgi:thioredoxin reductase